MTSHLVAILVLLVFSAFFSSSETAFTSLSFLQIRMLEEEKKRTSKLAASLAKQPDMLITTILIGNNIVNVSASALTTTYVISLWGNTAVGIGTGILTLLILIFGEITPKQLAINNNLAMVRFVAYPIKFFTIILFPVGIAIQWVGSLITRLFPAQQQGSLSRESLKHVVNVAEDEGIVEKYETSLVERVLHFGETTVKSIMTHRTQVFSISDDMTLREAFPSIIASGYSRIPIYHESPENITGILLLRNALAAAVDGRFDEPVSNFTVQPTFVPETKKVDEMLFQMKREKLQIAVVLDEYGGLSGIVTMEDIVEQLFGEIYDEHEPEKRDRIAAEGPHTYLIKADTSMQEIKDELELPIEGEDLSCTVAAFIIEQLGAIPNVGDVIEFPFGTCTVVLMQGKRIDLIRLVLRTEQQE